MRPVLKYVLYAFFTLALLMVLILCALNWYGKKWITENSNGQSASGVQYQSKIEVSIFPSPYFSAQKVIITNPKHTTQKLASLDSMSLRFSWIPLIQDELIVDEFVVKGLNIFIDVDKNGNSNWGPKNDPTLSMSPNENPIVQKNMNQAKTIKKFLVKDFRFENIRIYYRNSKENVIKRLIIDDFSIDNQNKDITVFNLKSKINELIFAIHTKIKIIPDEKTADFSELSLIIDDNSLSGSGSLLYKETPYLEMSLKGNKINLNAIVDFFISNTLSAVPSNVPSDPNDTSNLNVNPIMAILPLVLSNFSSKMEFQVNSLIYKQKLYDNINYTLLYKKNVLTGEPCTPVWILDLGKILEQVKIRTIHSDAKTNSPQWCK